MNIAIGAAVYLVTTFFLSAGLVRLRPYSRIARRLRLNLGVFPFLPALVVLAGLPIAARALPTARSGLEKLFVRLSGRRQYKRRHVRYYDSENSKRDGQLAKR